MDTKKEKLRFFVIWSLLNTILIPVGIILGFLLVINIFGYESDRTFPFKSTLVYCVWLSVPGLIYSIAQWILLRKQLKVTSLWILASIAGIIIGELCAGIVLWKLGIDREDLGWAQGGSALAEALIFLFSGALIGLFQMPLLKKNYHKTGLWIVSSCIGWGIIPLVFFIGGGLVYGAISGATLMWILEPKEK